MSETIWIQQAEGFLDETRAIEARLQRRMSDLGDQQARGVTIAALLRFYGQLHADLDYYCSFLIEF